MTAWIQEVGDKLSKPCKPDWNTGKAWAWEKMSSEAKQAGTLDTFPHKPRRGLAEHSFWGQVDRHMSRKSFTVGISFKNGRIVREEEE
jgi:hypothetical protein